VSKHLHGTSVWTGRGREKKVHGVPGNMAYSVDAGHEATRGQGDALLFNTGMPGSDFSRTAANLGHLHLGKKG